jgi:hypothetical protein
LAPSFKEHATRRITVRRHAADDPPGVAAFLL